jgi:nucleotide-binding universal stress UspA family protein
MDTALDRTESGERAAITGLSRIGVGVDGYPEGRDAVALGSALAHVCGANLLLVAVHADPIVVVPTGLDWTALERHARTELEELRASLAPKARIEVETDLSVPRALHRVVGREHRDLLVLGSSRKASEGHVRIGKRTRQLLCHFECSLAVAPRGLRERSVKFGRIGVGYDGEPESEAALALAGSIADAARAELYVATVVDDRLPPAGWSTLARIGGMAQRWEPAVTAEMRELRAQAASAAAARGLRAEVGSKRGRPADVLLSLSEQVDLLVIGSRRWGPVNRLLLGSTGEAVLHDAACPVLTVPRPSA